MLIKTSNISAQFLDKIFNESVETRVYPDDLKLADTTPVFKKKDRLNKIIIGLLVFYQVFQKYLKNCCNINL